MLDEGRIVADGSADQLAHELTTAAEVHWTSGGRRHVHAVREGDPSGFIRDLLANNPHVNRVAMLRAERRISRRELAEALGVHYQTIGYLERGEYSPSLHLALRIAAYFDVPVEVVFSLKPFKRLGE